MRQIAAVRTLVLVVAFIAYLAPARNAHAQRDVDRPEPVIRALVMAIYANDVAGYNRLTIPHPLRSRLTSGGRVNESALSALREDPDSLQIKPLRPFMFQGKEAQPDAKGLYPAGTSALFLAAHQGGPVVVALVRQPDGWKVDIRWWVAALELASGREPDRTGPEFAIRSLLAAMLRLDRDEARRYAAPGSDMNVLFAGAPSQREPSGVLDATVFEMPLVEIEPGEFARTPSGQIVEGVRAPDRKVFVGQFGPVEMPFVLRRVGSAWRVEGEPYFSLMLR